MEKAAPLIKIHFTDGRYGMFSTFNNFDPNYERFEQLTRKKYRKNKCKSKETLRILSSVRIEDVDTLVLVMVHAEIILIDAWTKIFGGGITFRDSENNDATLYFSSNVGSGMLLANASHAIRHSLGLSDNDDFIQEAVLDPESLLNNLKYWEQVAATKENFGKAISLRDVQAIIKKHNKL